MLPSILLHPWFNYTSASAYIVPATLALYKGQLIFGLLSLGNSISSQLYWDHCSNKSSSFCDVYGQYNLCVFWFYVLYGLGKVRNPILLSLSGNIWMSLIWTYFISHCFYNIDNPNWTFYYSCFHYLCSLQQIIILL
jgi:hypothetical protein